MSGDTPPDSEEIAHRHAAAVEHCQGGISYWNRRAVAHARLGDTAAQTTAEAVAGQLEGVLNVLQPGAASVVTAEDLG